MKFRIRKSKKGEYYFVVTARNGQVILVSEMYVRKQSCLRTINSINKQFSKLLPIIVET